MCSLFLVRACICTTWSWLIVRSSCLWLWNRLVVACFQPLGVWIECTLRAGRTPWSTIFLEKLIVAQLVNNFPDFHEFQKLISMFIRARHWTLLFLEPNESSPSTPSYPIFLWFILILSFHPYLGLPVFRPRSCMCFSSIPCVLRAGANTQTTRVSRIAATVTSWCATVIGSYTIIRVSPLVDLNRTRCVCVCILVVTPWDCSVEERKRER
jgi:hypothetical protein